jgi:hypothetical protein
MSLAACGQLETISVPGNLRSALWRLTAPVSVLQADTQCLSCTRTCSLTAYRRCAGARLIKGASRET